jgi:hypothetical protein
MAFDEAGSAWLDWSARCSRNGASSEKAPEAEDGLLTRVCGHREGLSRSAWAIFQARLVLGTAPLSDAISPICGWARCA